MSEQEPDIVDRALADLMETPGSDRPPDEVVERVLIAVRRRSVAVRQRDPDRGSLRSRIAWGPLTACVLVMVTGSWIAGFHAALWSRPAGRRIDPDGTVWVHYTDGRVVPR